MFQQVLEVSCNGLVLGLLSSFALQTTFALGIVPFISKAFMKPVSLNRIIFWAIKHTKFGLVGSIRGRLCHGIHQQGILITRHLNFSEILQS